MQTLEEYIRPYGAISKQNLASAGTLKYEKLVIALMMSGYLEFIDADKTGLLEACCSISKGDPVLWKIIEQSHEFQSLYRDVNGKEYLSTQSNNSEEKSGEKSNETNTIKKEKSMICKKCGAELADDAQFCSSCGAAIALEDTSQNAQQGEVSAKSQTQEEDSDNTLFGKIKVFLSIVGTLFLIIALLHSCFGISFASHSSEKKAIKAIQTSYFNDYPSMDIGEAVDSFFKKPKWSAGIPEDTSLRNCMLVNCKGDIIYNNKSVEAEIQFLLHTDTGAFELNAFEMNGIPQNQWMINSLISAMYE